MWSTTVCCTCVCWTKNKIFFKVNLGDRSIQTIQELKRTNKSNGAMPSVRKREKAVWTLDSVNRLLLWLSPDKMRDKSDLFSDQRSKGGKISTGREAERQCVLPHERANKLSKVNRESDSWRKVNKIISNIDSFHKMINGTEKCKWH